MEINSSDIIKGLFERYWSQEISFYGLLILLSEYFDRAELLAKLKEQK